VYTPVNNRCLPWLSSLRCPFWAFSSHLFTADLYVVPYT
jgi:hypothetical protein